MRLFRIFNRRPPQSTYLRNFIFGVEDSLVSTVGLLAGVSASGVSGRPLLVTGLVLIIVEGLSMGIGSFLSEETTSEMEGNKPDTKLAIGGALIMLLSYCLAGLIPLLPYLVFLGSTAVIVSVASSLLGLATLGLCTALYYQRQNPWKHALRMFILGGLAVSAGMLVGKLFHL